MLGYDHFPWQQIFALRDRAQKWVAITSRGRAGKATSADIGTPFTVTTRGSGAGQEAESSAAGSSANVSLSGAALTRPPAAA